MERIKKGVKKVARGIKKVVKKVGAAIGKLGIVGQIGMMFLMPYAMGGSGKYVWYCRYFVWMESNVTNTF
jgi:hypothetical protein